MITVSVFDNLYGKEDAQGNFHRGCHVLIHSHSRATTSPKVRSAIQASTERAAVLGKRFGVTYQTVYKWKQRDRIHDRSHTSRRLQTTLAPAAVAVVPLVSLDGLFALVTDFLNPGVYQSGLDRCMHRHGLGNCCDLESKGPLHKQKALKATHLHINANCIVEIAKESGSFYLYLAIDGATRLILTHVYKSKSASNVGWFMLDLDRPCPRLIRTVLTDNGLEFTGSLFVWLKRRPFSHHKLSQTNEMVERFTARIE